MNGLYLLMSMGIGGTIGGVTNALAIKMLFRPRKAWKIGRWKVPFTPGLIPKRRDEIAVQLGRIVAEHLVTEEGIRERFLSEETRSKLEGWIAGQWDEWESSDATWYDKGIEMLGEEAVAQLVDQWDNLLEKGSGYVVELLSKGEWSDRTIRSFLPPEWVGEGMSKQTIVHNVSHYITGELFKFVASDRGEEWLKQVAKQMGGQGLFGSLAGMFMNNSGMVTMIREPVLRYIDSDEARGYVGRLLDERWEDWIDRRISDIAAAVGEERLKGLLYHTGAQWLDARKLLGVSVSSTLGRFAMVKVGWIRRASEWLIGWGSGQIHKVLKAIDIRQTVQEQVSRFPIERIEEILLEVSGKEFRMITWLGVLLGILIGALQGVVWLL